MVLGDNGRHHSVTLGGDGSPIVNHTVKNEVLQRCPSGSPLSVILKHLNKGTRNHHSVTHGPAPEMKNRDGHSFAYVLHYLITGDLIYPLHEGFHRVDALLKELTSLGLADDVMRYATQDSSGRSKSKSAKRRATVFTLPRQASASSGVGGGGRSAERKASDTLPKRADSSLAKYQSVQSLHVVADRSLSMSYEPDSGGPVAMVVQHSSSLSNLDAENEVEFREHLNKSQLTLARCSRSSNSSGHRFLSAVKRYLSIKSGDSQREPAVCSSAKRAPSSVSVSTTSAESGSVWRPNHAAAGGGGGGGVFRPNSARGATLVLLAAADGVAVYGQRAILESLFAEYRVTSLRSFSSAFIDSKVVYQTDEHSSGFDIYDGYSSSSYNSNTSSLPKRSNSSEGSYYGGSSGSASSSSTSSQSELLTSLYHQRIKPAGFAVTVQSNWRDKHTLEVYHQWLLHRKNNSKSMGRRLSHPNVLTALSSSPSAGTATGATGVTNPVTRRASVIQRFFNKSALTLHMSTDV